jgi:DeoR family suf operon transcriptional repressor
MLRKQFFDSSRGRIAELLQTGSRTVEDLASDLGLTASAVRAQLTSMERDGLVKRVGRIPGVTRPSHVFELTPELEQLLSRAYIPLLTHVIHVFARGLRRDELNKLMRRTGKSLAAEFAGRTRASGTLYARASTASDFLNKELGAVTRVVRRNGSLVIQGQGCPLAAITDKEPSVCLAVESLLMEIVGTSVRECCDRAGRPRCCFEIHASDPR